MARSGAHDSIDGQNKSVYASGAFKVQIAGFAWNNKRHQIALPKHVWLLAAADQPTMPQFAGYDSSLYFSGRCVHAVCGEDRNLPKGKHAARTLLQQSVDALAIITSFATLYHLTVSAACTEIR